MRGAAIVTRPLGMDETSAAIWVTAIGTDSGGG